MLAELVRHVEAKPDPYWTCAKCLRIWRATQDCPCDFEFEGRGGAREELICS
jgi:hypothetical protein